LNFFFSTANDAAAPPPPPPPPGEMEEFTSRPAPQNSTTGYASQNQAASGALKNSNGASIKQNTEYGGYIYKGADGRYHYTGPIPGSGDNVDLSKAKAPRDSTIVGDYHTHGDYSIPGNDNKPVRTHDPLFDAYNSDHFSMNDKKHIAVSWLERPEYRGYLGTPSGKFLVYNPETDREEELK
jgi:hypothetical protein